MKDDLRQQARKLVSMVIGLCSLEADWCGIEEHHVQRMVWHTMIQLRQRAVRSSRGVRSVD